MSIGYTFDSAKREGKKALGHVELKHNFYYYIRCWQMNMILDTFKELKVDVKDIAQDLFNPPDKKDFNCYSVSQPIEWFISPREVIYKIKKMNVLVDKIKDHSPHNFSFFQLYDELSNQLVRIAEESIKNQHTIHVRIG